MFFSVLFYCIRRGGKGFTEVRFVLQFGTFCFEPLEHFVLRIIDLADISEGRIGEKVSKFEVQFVIAHNLYYLCILKLFLITKIKIHGL